MIGPLWRVDDSIAHEVVTRLYREMFKSPVLDGEHVAETSNPTVVEASKEVPSERRPAFVHIRIEIVELFLGPTDPIPYEDLISSWHNHQKYR